MSYTGTVFKERYPKRTSHLDKQIALFVVQLSSTKIANGIRAIDNPPSIRVRCYEGLITLLLDPSRDHVNRFTP